MQTLIMAEVLDEAQLTDEALHTDEVLGMEGEQDTEGEQDMSAEPELGRQEEEVSAEVAADACIINFSILTNARETPPKGRVSSCVAGTVTLKPKHTGSRILLFNKLFANDLFARFYFNQIEA